MTSGDVAQRRDDNHVGRIRSGILAHEMFSCCGLGRWLRFLPVCIAKWLRKQAQLERKQSEYRYYLQ